MPNPRFKILAALGGLLVLVLVGAGYWISGWGTITLRAHEMPLAKVLRSVERQGGVKIATNADPQTPVTLEVRRAPVFDVMDTLAVRLEGRVQLAQIAAPDRQAIAEVLEVFRHNGEAGGWKVFSAGFGGRFLPPAGLVPDPRAVEWKATAMEEAHLQSFFDQGAQKTGALFVLPEDWNPPVAHPPRSGPVGRVVSALTRSAGGESEEVVLLTVRPRKEIAEGAPRRPSTVFSAPRRRQASHPEWAQERMAAQIATLPADQQAGAQQRNDEMRAFWQGLRGLSREERRAKIAEWMNNPEVREQMEEYRAARDAKRTPEQRERRMKRYLERKEAMKKGAR